jgi:hypothetical protein
MSPTSTIRKPRQYLTKDDVRKRRGWKSKISVDRGWKEYGTLPPPTIWNGKYPLWAEDVLDAFEAKMVKRPKTQYRPTADHILPAQKALARKRKRRAARAQAEVRS